MKTKKTLGLLLLPVTAIVLVVIFAAFFIADVRTSMWNQSVSEICEMTKQGGRSFDIYLSRDTEMLSYMAQSFSKTNSDDEADIISGITSLSRLESDYFVINLERGLLYSNHSDSVVELNGTEINKYASYKGSVINEPAVSRFTGIMVLTCFENFRFADGTRGIVQSEHAVSSIADEFSLSFYGGSGYSDIINCDGKILIRSNNVNNNRTFNNIFDIIDFSGNSQEELQLFKDSLAAGKSGAAHFKYRDEDYVYSFMPLETADNWYIISIIPNSAIMENLRSFIINPRIIIAFIILCALLLYEFSAIIRYFHRKLRESGEDIKRCEKLFSLMSDDTDTVFLIVNSHNFTVDYISENAERILGIPVKTLKKNLALIKPADYDEENSDDYKDILNLQSGAHKTIKNVRINDITGCFMDCVDTIYRSKSKTSDKLIVVIETKMKE